MKQDCALAPPSANVRLQKQKHDNEPAKKIREMVDLDTTDWNTEDPEVFLSMVHPDMAWLWPPTADADGPVD